MTFSTWQVDDCDKPDWDGIESTLASVAESLTWLINELIAPIIATGQWLDSNQQAVTTHAFRPVVKNVKNVTNNVYDSSQPLLTYIVSGLSELQASAATLSAAIIAAGGQPPNISSISSQASNTSISSGGSSQHIPGVVYPDPPGISPLPSVNVGGGMFIDPVTGGPVSTVEGTASNATGIGGTVRLGGQVASGSGAFAPFSFDEEGQGGPSGSGQVGTERDPIGASVDPSGIPGPDKGTWEVHCIRQVSEQAITQLAACLQTIANAEGVPANAMLDTVADVLGQPRPSQSGKQDADFDHPNVLLFGERSASWHQRMLTWWNGGLDAYYNSGTILKAIEARTNSFPKAEATPYHSTGTIPDIG